MPQLTNEDIQNELEKRKSQEHTQRVRYDELLEGLYKKAQGIGERGKKGERGKTSYPESHYKELFGDLYYHGMKQDVEEGKILNTDAIESYKQFRAHNPGIDPRPDRVRRWWEKNSQRFVKMPTGTPKQEAAKEQIGDISKDIYLQNLKQLSNLEPSELEYQTKQLLPQLLPMLMQEYQNPSALSMSLFPDAQDAQRSPGMQFINQLVGPQALQQNVPTLLSALGNMSREDITQPVGNAYEALKGLGSQGYGMAQDVGSRLLQSLKSLGR